MHFRKGLLIGVTAVFLTSGLSYAEDNSRFTGFSLGFFGGLSFGDDVETDYYGNDSTLDLDGAGLGVYGGYNYQINEYVFGIEADIGLNSGKDLADNFDDDNDWTQLSVDWTSHIRAKAGMVFYDNTLVYVAAGLAMTQIELDDIDPTYGVDDESHTGWSVGCGVDYMATESIAFRFEYLYDNFGSENYALTEDDGTIDRAEVDDFDMHTFRVAISYLF